MPLPGLSRAEAEAIGIEAPFGRDAGGKPKAPYGYRKDGGIKLRPGPPLGPRKKKAAAPKAPARRRGNSSPSPGTDRGPKPPDYRQGITQVANEIVGALSMAGLARGDDILLADAAVLADLVDPIAEGLNDLAPKVPWLGLILERLNTVAPYTGLAGALSKGAAQLAANHIPRARGVLIAQGLAIDPSVIANRAKLQALQLMQQQREEAAALGAEIDQALAYENELRRNAAAEASAANWAGVGGPAPTPPGQAADQTEPYGPEAGNGDDLDFPATAAGDVEPF